ncbi:MAG: DUF2339 domain-containing protein [Defluviitaleaceae bacterium]|nr:DUF2339 domain-containing protein [Defluviitaleaceae bacterium]
MERDIREMVYGLRKSIDDIDGQLKAIEKSDTFKENTELAQKNAKMSADMEKLEVERSKLAADNAALKNSLYEQYFNEKLNTVNKFQRNVEIFFNGAATGEINRLNALEGQIRQRLYNLQAHSAQVGSEIAQEAGHQINLLGQQIAQRIEEARHQAKSFSVSEAEKAEMERLRQENITGEQISHLSRKNNFERYIGLNILNAIGVVLFIIGAIAASRFGYTWVSFALGSIFLVGGEIMNRRRPNVFSLGMTAGGLGISYVSLAIGHFLHETIPIYPALGICVAITALAFYLSTRYKSQALLAITLVGGYLPIMSILLDGGSTEQALLFGMMGYFALFNLLSLTLAFRNKWTVATFIGLFLNIAGVALLSFETWSYHPYHQQALELVFVGFSMAVYTAIPIIGTYVTKAKFGQSDIALVGINTFAGGIILLANLHFSSWNNFMGLAAAICTVIYLGLTYIVGRKFENAKAMTTVLYVAAIALAFAFVPLQFSLEWLTVGWAALAMILAVFGILKNHNNSIISAATIGGFAITCLLILNIAHNIILEGNWDYIVLQAGSVAAGGLVVLVLLAIKNQLYNAAQKSFKYIVMIGLWLFGILMLMRLEHALWPQFVGNPINLAYLMVALGAVGTMVYGKILPRLPGMACKVTEIMGTVFVLMGLFGIFALNIFISPTTTAMDAQPTNILFTATAILVVVEVVGIFAVYDITRRAVLKKIIGIQYLPLIVSTYIVLVFTFTLTLDYGLDFASFWISLVYIATALLWTILGFVRRYALLRRAGLALSLFSVVKLFLFDLALLTQEFRILSYFIMGAVLVIISFVYQYFSKRLDLAIKIEQKEKSEE